jgi:hypothetical protein
VQPGHADAWHLLGVVALAKRPTAAGAGLHWPRHPACSRSPSRVFTSTQGNVQKALQQPEAALASFEQAIAHQPDLADAHALRAINPAGTAAASTPPLALAWITFIALQPGAAQAYYYRGIAQQQLQASSTPPVASYDRAITLWSPRWPRPTSNRGVALQALQHFDAAVCQLRPRPCPAGLTMAARPISTVAARCKSPAPSERLPLPAYDRAIALQSPTMRRPIATAPTRSRTWGKPPPPWPATTRPLRWCPATPTPGLNRGIALGVLRKAEDRPKHMLPPRTGDRPHACRSAPQPRPVAADARRHPRRHAGLSQRPGRRTRTATMPIPALLLCLSSDTDVRCRHPVCRALCALAPSLKRPLRPHWPAARQPQRCPERALNIGFVSGDLYSHAVATFHRARAASNLHQSSDRARTARLLQPHGARRGEPSACKAYF